MKKLLLLVATALLAACTASPAFAVANSLIITQRNSNDTANILRTLDNPPSDGLLIWNKASQLPAYLVVGSGLNVSGGVLSAVPATIPTPTWADLAGKPTFAPVAYSGNYDDLANKPAIPVVPAPYVFDFGEPVTRALSLSTSYQALNPGKAAEVVVSASCGASLSLTTGSTCTLQVRTSQTAGLNCSNGTLYAVSTNANTGALTVGLALTQRIGGPVNIKLRSGSFFILCPVSGTFTVDAAIEQTVG